MKPLLLLILCLLVISKSFSQEDIPNNKYVILTEDQARKTIKDLIHMDALEQINVKLEERIDIFLNKENVYQKVIASQDSIIKNKDIIIKYKDAIINAKKFVELHSYAGLKTYNIDIVNTIFYYQIQLESKILNIGAQANFQPNVPQSNINGFNYSLFIEFKIF